MQKLVYVMVYLGLALMVWNIISYIRFARDISRVGNWETERRILNIPIVLLVLFAIGYLMVGVLGEPDLIVAGILFGGSIFVAVIEWLYRRIVRRIRENERLEADLKAAKEANEAKTFFLSNMSHDIRTPLNAVLGFTVLARGERVTEDEKDEYLRKIENSGKQLMNIVDDVLEMSRIESGKLELTAEPTDLVRVIGESYEVIAQQMAGKGIAFHKRCCMTHPVVLCDGKRLERVIMNLLSNAYKFTPKGGEVLVGMKETAADEKEATFELHVRDTGIGMSREFAERIFEPFEREKTAEVSGIQGTGLGMAITKSIVDAMHGRTEVITEQGKGTEFIIYLTFPRAGMAAEEKEKGREIGDFTGTRLLMAEDNAVNAEIACAILGQAGFEVDVAVNGQEAVDLLKNACPDYYGAVLMDIQMPVMDGLTAARKIREDKAYDGIPIIAMTANAFKEDAEAAEAAGMQAHIPKPLDVDKMLSTIREVLDR